MNKLDSSLGSFTLERLPKTTKGDLRAWDAADELLLNTIAEEHLESIFGTPKGKTAKTGGGVLSNNLSGVKAAKQGEVCLTPILIVNDSFGALATALHQYPRHSWGDSYLAHLATLDNLKLNNLYDANYQAIPSDEDLKQSYDLVIIKIPKTIGLLEDQLCRLKAHIHADTTIIASAMSKHIHTSTLKLFEKLIGTTTTSRATKKARLIFSQNDNPQIQSSPYPKTISDEALQLSLINHANVFAKDKLDMGSRFLIEQLTNCPASKHIVDLGCGNGALGIMASRIHANAQVSFIDESYAAIQSAKQNYKNEKQPDKASANFYTSDCFNQFDGSGVDLILCNPPFHQNHSIGDHIAWEMFKQSHEQLESDGEMWVIGNRHLAYHVKLKNLFGNCETMASNKKFVVLMAKKGLYYAKKT